MFLRNTAAARIASRVRMIDAIAGASLSPAEKDHIAADMGAEIIAALKGHDASPGAVIATAGSTYPAAVPPLPNGFRFHTVAEYQHGGHPGSYPERTPVERPCLNKPHHTTDNDNNYLIGRVEQEASKQGKRATAHKL